MHICALCKLTITTSALHGAHIYIATAEICILVLISIVLTLALVYHHHHKLINRTEHCEIR